MQTDNNIQNSDKDIDPPFESFKWGRFLLILLVTIIARVLIQGMLKYNISDELIMLFFIAGCITIGIGITLTIITLKNYYKDYKHTLKDIDWGTLIFIFIGLGFISVLIINLVRNYYYNNRYKANSELIHWIGFTVIISSIPFIISLLLGWASSL